ncbi:type IV secretion system protein VirB6 [Novosphingobium sp. CF614]|uniref:type IV secretion system protein n=1 Tax=Novosphingobium sp. CF614 TaxID=1884364 RepID=UPI0008E79B47|nr:type IV secretion system protein [Novosphingobium sp. CF614]SFF87632.1 type IV secretion system protein VirB6 [Novosphingobium sp. CF614]
MSAACEQLTEVASAGVSPALRAVDCVANEMAASAFGRLFGAGGAMGPVLTILLTLYIAFFAFSLLTGRTSLGVSALTPRMLRLGVVLTFATSWIAYQGVVWNLAIGGPDWIAALLMGAKGSATQLFGDRIDIVFGAINDISQASAGEGAAPSGGPASAQGLFTPESVMWMGALLLLLGTVGVLLTARIALAVLLAVGPIFVVLALFGGTRGLTVGWLRGVVLTAVTPLFVVLGGGITLELLVPIINQLVQSANMGELDGRAAMALFLVASVHVALMVMIVKVAATMVSGWRVFGLAGSDDERSSGARGGQDTAPAPAASMPTSSPLAATQQRRAPVVAASAAAMGDAAYHESNAAMRSSERRTVVTQVTGGGIEPLRHGENGTRARGIGSRFRSASNDTGKLPAKEKTR